MMCTLSIFGRPITNFDLATRNLFRSRLGKLDGCDECVAYEQALELSRKWKRQQARLLAWETVGPCS